MPKSGFQLVKHEEKIADLLADDLVANSINLKCNKSFSTTNRLINHQTNFVKDWEARFKKNQFNTNLIQLKSYSI